MKTRSHLPAIPKRDFIISLSLTLSFMSLAMVSGWTAESPASAGIFNVRQFGAKGDGRTLDTSAIQKALDECGTAGGGAVRFPAGTYLSQPIFLHSGTTLQLEAGAILQATAERADYVNPAKTNGFIAFVNGTNLHNLAVIGPA